MQEVTLVINLLELDLLMVVVSVDLQLISPIHDERFTTF